MKLAFSNIAWPADADAWVAGLLRSRGVSAVEVAPTKAWPNPIEATEADALAYRRTWEARGVRIVAMQALLFGRPELTLFDEQAVTRKTIDYLAGMIQLAGWLGVEAMVFGSPKNRLRGGKPLAEVTPLAVAAFRELGGLAARHGTTFCIEANPPQYGCDYVTTLAEAAELVRAVATPGFGLHVDVGGLALTADLPPDPALFAGARHYHISEPFLHPIGRGDVPHSRLAETLNQSGYDGWRSIEMRLPDGDWKPVLEESLSYVIRTYFGQATPAAA